MSSAIYLRLLGQAVTLGLHAVNSVVMLVAMQNEDLLRDPEIKSMTSLQGQYLTVWNIVSRLQVFSSTSISLL